MAHPQWSDLTLGGDDHSYVVDGSEGLRDAVAALAGQARRRLDVLTPDLEPSLYDTADFLAALRALAVDSARSQVRVLVVDSQPAVKHGHRVIELARRLTTSIDLHRPGPESPIGREAFLLADDRGLFWRADSDDRRGSICFNDSLGVRRLRARFDELWEESQPDPEMRRLHV